MTSPSPLPIPPRNDTPLDVRTTNYSISRIFGMLIEPERGQVSPDFIEYQDAADEGVEGGDDQMETRAVGTSLTAPEVPIRIPSTSDIAEVRSHPDDHLSPNLPSEYHHDEYDNQFHFVPNEHACQVHEAVAREAAAATTWEAECTPLTPYSMSLSTLKHTTPTKKTATQIKKTVKMPREYRGVAKMPKGWAHVTVEEGEAEVEIVWERQKTALLGCTTPGINGA